VAPSEACAHSGRSRTRRGDHDCRCRCGSLVARIVSEGVELRCRRCKRTLLVPWSARDGFEAPTDVDAGVPAAVRETSVGSAA